MHSLTVKIIQLLKRHPLNNTEKEAINKEISETTSAAYVEGLNGYNDPCGCGQPSCGICN